ncbi:Protein-tyrosine phosphatase, partial [Oesophagostomum dentatum]
GNQEGREDEVHVNLRYAVPKCGNTRAKHFAAATLTTAEDDSTQIDKPRPGRRRRPKRDLTLATCEDDGTQVERATRRKRSVARRGMAQVDTPEFRSAFKDFCLNVNKIGVQGLLVEYATMRAQTQPIGSKPKVAFDANPQKNRYKDVFCTDETRVVLSWPSGTNDYIHANWVNGDVPKKFICTQGPTENTVEDFWRMIWQEKCKSIVMLCNITECGKKKCEQYWPEAGKPPVTLSGCNLKIRHVKSQNVEENIFQTTLELSLDDKKHTVEHIQWKDWPDRGVPPTNLSSFRLLMRVRKLTPIVVHCSAGIGRTGTIVGLDLLYTKLEKGVHVTLESVVRDLRKERHGSVQTDAQYLYMHRILIAVAENKRVITAADVQKFTTDYDIFCKSKGYL